MRAWCSAFTPSTEWPESGRPRWRCTSPTGWRTCSRTGSSSCRCTPTRPVSGRSTRLTPWPVCCSPPGSRRTRSRPAWKPGRPDGVTMSRARRSCLCSTTPLGTSRRRLAALEDATQLSLDTLSPAEAATLLVRLAARPTLSVEDTAIGEISRLCGFLPLAIGMLASQLRNHPAWTATYLASELAAAKDRLELMHAENLSVGAAFDLSYADL